MSIEYTPEQYVAMNTPTLPTVESLIQNYPGLKVAMDKGLPWESEDERPTDAHRGVVFWCDDCETWHCERALIGYSYTPADRSLGFLSILVDSDGDRDTDWYPLTAEGVEQLRSAIEGDAASKRRYAEWMVANGSDPADVVLMPNIRRRTAILRLALLDEETRAVEVLNDETGELFPVTPELRTWAGGPVDASGPVTLSESALEHLRRSQHLQITRDRAGREIFVTTYDWTEQEPEAERAARAVEAAQESLQDGSYLFFGDL